VNDLFDTRLGLWRKVADLPKRILQRLNSAIWTWPFAEPRWSILYATFVGIILSAGMRFLFDIFDKDRVGHWKVEQTSGLLFIASAAMLSLVAWFMQFFQDYLEMVQRSGTPFYSKCIDFRSMQWRRWALRTRIAALLALALFVSAIVLLTLWYSRPPDAVQGLQTCSNL